MGWRPAIARGTLTGTAVSVLLLAASAIGARNIDELLVVLPIMAIELVLLNATMLTIVYLPVVALLRAAGFSKLVLVAGFVLWPTPVLLVRLVGELFRVNPRPTLADDIAFLAQNPGMAIPLLTGLAVAGMVFASVSARPWRSDRTAH